MFGSRRKVRKYFFLFQFFTLTSPLFPLFSLDLRKFLDMVRYFFEDTKFQFKQRRINNLWLKTVAESEIKRLGSVNLIFCSDNYILDINQQYLQHDYFTDVITFDYCEGDLLSGDIFISVDTVRENAVTYQARSFEEELNRVMVHGLLHLIGYDDHTPEQQKQMRAKENYYLQMRENLL